MLMAGAWAYVVLGYRGFTSLGRHHSLGARVWVERFTHGLQCSGSRVQSLNLIGSGVWVLALRVNEVGSSLFGLANDI